MDRRMVFNHYRFFISRYVTSHLSVMAVTFILNVVIDGVVGDLMSVRRQGFWNQGRPKLRESLGHLVDLIMRRAVCDASVALRVSFV